MIIPKISVVMPVYNTKEEYFRRSIESILSQTYQNFELLIVDDFSKPYIQTIVKSYYDQRIKYLRLKKNSGAAIARNYGLDRAKGEYIAFLDSDDISLESRLEKQLKFLDKNPKVGCLATATRAIGTELKDLDFKVYQSNFDIESRLVFKGNVFCQSSVMLRKSILDRSKIRYKTEYVPAEDYAFWLDLVGHTQFSMLPDVLTVYRSHLGNITHRKLNVQIKKCYLAQKKAIEKYCEISTKDKVIWEKYLKAKLLEKNELETLQNCLEKVIKTLVKKGYTEADVIKLFKGKFQKLYRKTRTIRGQYLLFSSDLNDFFKLSFGLRLLYFITRGIL